MSRRTRELRRRLGGVKRPNPPPGLLERIRAEVPEELFRRPSGSPSPTPAGSAWHRLAPLAAAAASIAVVVLAGWLAIRLRPPSAAPTEAEMERRLEVGAVAVEPPPRPTPPTQPAAATEPTRALPAASPERDQSSPPAVSEDRASRRQAAAEPPVRRERPPAAPSPPFRSMRRERQDAASEVSSFEESMRADLDAPIAGQAEVRAEAESAKASATVMAVEEKEAVTVTDRFRDQTPTVAAEVPPVEAELVWRGETLELRGRAAPGSRIEVQLDDGSLLARGASDGEGLFTLELPRLSAETRVVIRVTPPGSDEPLARLGRVVEPAAQR